jgi:hypothetical protein
LTVRIREGRYLYADSFPANNQPRKRLLNTAHAVITNKIHTTHATQTLGILALARRPPRSSYFILATAAFSAECSARQETYTLTHPENHQLLFPDLQSTLLIHLAGRQSGTTTQGGRPVNHLQKSCSVRTTLWL